MPDEIRLVDMPSKNQKKLKATSRLQKDAVPEAQKPQWPLLHPLVPTTDLSLETILEDQIILIRNLLTKSLCQQYVNFLSTLPLTTTPGIPKKGEALRVNDRFQIEDYDFAQKLWSTTGLEQLVTNASDAWGGEVCGLNPRIRIYRHVVNGCLKILGR